jgi:hypothetical protein
MRFTSGGWVENSCAGQTLGEQHVPHFLGIGLQHRSGAGGADLLQGAGDALGLAGELHRRGIGQVLALA